MIPTSQQAYSSNRGSVLVDQPEFVDRDPTSSDTNYPLFKTWINSSSNATWRLLSFSTTGGFLSANWVLVSISVGAFSTLSDNSGTVVVPDGGGNIQLKSSSGLTTTTAGVNELTIGLDGSVVNNFSDGSNNSGASGNTFTVVGNPFQGVSVTVGAFGSVTSVQNADALGNKGVATFDPDFFSVSSGEVSLDFASPLPVPSGGTGASSFTPYAVICGGTTSTNPLQSIASVGTTGQVLKSNGAGALPTFQNETVEITVQQIRATVTGIFSTSNVIPFGAIPTNAQGSQVISASITPKNAANILIFDFSCYAFASVGTSAIISLIEGATVNAIYGTSFSTGGVIMNMAWRFYKIAGTTSATTYSVRSGPAGAATLYLNNFNGVTQVCGGVESINFTITEVIP